MEVHKELGGGFSEVVYKDALQLEFADRNIFFKREKQYAVRYKDTLLPHYYFADLSCSIRSSWKLNPYPLVPMHIAQTLNYLKASGCKIGLLVNFNNNRLEYHRLIL